MKNSNIPYIVREGDALSLLALRGGFDAEKVWNDPDNEPIRALRQDPEVLNPCDLLYIPAEPEYRRHPIKVGEENVFVAKLATVTIRMQCEDDKEKPIANEAFTIEGATPPITGTTDGAGVLEAEIPVTMKTVRIFFPRLSLEIMGELGHLNPVTEPSGVWQRLQALGYIESLPFLLFDDEGNEQLKTYLLEDALRSFQKDHKINKTGKLDDATRDALMKVHGA